MPATEPDPRALLAASAPWLGGLLNLLPGLGTGYIYQRRWRAYWISTGLASGWALLGALQVRGAVEAEGLGQPSPIGLAGLLLLGLITATEAFLTARKARHD
jgi:hypothetical protein